jgi:hypothetical protein
VSDTVLADLVGISKVWVEPNDLQNIMIHKGLTDFGKDVVHVGVGVGKDGVRKRVLAFEREWLLILTTERRARRRLSPQ